MPRGSSPPDLPGGNRPTGPLGPMNIGEVANAPFAVLPDPSRLFAVRAARLAALAPGHQLEGYMQLLVAVVEAQQAIVATLPLAALPTAEHLDQAHAHAMPPISPGQFAADDVSDATFLALLDRLGTREALRPVAPMLTVIRTATAAERADMMTAVLLDTVPADQIAPHVLAAAAVQVHFSRLAARLDVTRLQKVATGACPACGGRPVASAVVSWEGAANTRFCTCSICATLWNAPRVTCLSCGTDKGIVYHGLEGAPDNVQAETCEACGSYVKILHQHKDAGLEPVADDVASLGLDIKLREEGLARASANPFLLGY